MTRVPTTSMAFVCILFLSTGCAGSTNGDTPATATSPPKAAAGWAVGAVEGVATDERCTATATLTSGLGRVGLALDNLVGMTLDRDALGATGSAWRFDMTRGFLENQELSEFGFGGAAGCDKLAATGRLTGYASGWLNTDTSVQTMSAVHLFRSESGASNFLAWYPTLMKVGDSLGSGGAVSAVESSPVPSLGQGAVRVDVTSSNWAVRDVAFRIKNIVGVVSVGANSKASWPVDPETVAPAAQAKVLSATVTDAPLDAVAALSVPLQRTEFPADLRTLSWDAFFGGTLDTEDAAGMATDPAATKQRLVTNGFQYTTRALYTTNGSVPRLSSAVSVYAMAGGAVADRKAIIAGALSGDAQTQPATLFDVGIPGAVGWTRTVSDGGMSFLDTRVILPAQGRLLPFTFVHDSTTTDRRADVVRLARQLQTRLDSLTGL